MIDNTDETTLVISGQKVRAISAAISELVQAIRACESAGEDNMSACVDLAMQRLPAQDAALIKNSFRAHMSTPEEGETQET